MAKYDVRFSCGHTEIKDLVGKVVDRERKIEWMESQGLCSECYRAEQTQKTTQQSKSAGLPELEGSEKQVAWANKIRLQMIGIVQDTINGLTKGRGTTQIEEQIAKIGKDGILETLKANAKAKGANEEQTKKAVDQIQSLFNNLDRLNTFKTTTSAKWIIDNRI
jgi:hypothetical protein